MVYVRSNTMKAYVIEGHYIPASVLSDQARKQGVKPWLVIDTSAYAALTKNPMFKSLVKHHLVAVTETEPPEFTQTMERVSHDKEVLAKQLEDVREQMKGKDDTIQQLQGQLGELKEQVESRDADLAAAHAEGEEQASLIEELTAEVERLRALVESPEGE